MVITWLLPAVPGFVSNKHPPIYTPVTRLVDPIGEFAFCVLLAGVLSVDGLRTRIRTRRLAARDQRPEYGDCPNEMIVESAV